MEKIVKYLNIYVLASFLFFVFHDAKAANELAQTFTLDGHLTQKATTDALLDSSAKIVVQVLDPSKNCILYEEQQTVDTTSSAGYFSIQVGSNTGSAKRTANDAGLTMAQVFQNTSSIVGKDASGKTCPVDGGTGFPTYVPTAKDIRYFRLTVTPSSTNTADVLSPDIEIGSTPSSLVAQTFQGYIPTQFLFVGTGDLTQANVQSIFATGNAAKLTTLLATDPSLYLARNATSGLVQMPSGSGTPTGVAAGQMWYDSGTLKYYNGTSVQTLGVSGAGITSLVAGTGLTGGTITTSGTVAVDVGTTVGKIVQVATGDKLPVISGANLTALNGTEVQSGTIGGTTAMNTSGNIQTSGSVTAATGSIAALSTGQISIYDHASTTTNYITLRAPVTASLTADYTLTLPVDDGTSGQFMKTDGSGGLSWQTLSSANLSDGANLINSSQMPANCAAGQTLTFLSPTGSWTCSNIVVSGSNFSTQVMNTVLAGPTSGADATSTFRALVAADIPNLDAAKITTGTLAVARGGTGTATGSITGTGALTFTAGGPNQNVTLTPSGTGYTVLNGNVGIGTTIPGQALSVSGTVESTAGGFKFPDGTTQTTAVVGGAISGLTSTKIPKATGAASLGNSQLTDNGTSGVDFSNYKITFGGTINTFIHTGSSATPTNTFVGIQGGNATMTGSQNNIVGGVALYSNTTGSSNNGMGYNVLYANTTGSHNNAIGEGAMSVNTTGFGNVGLGWGALSSLVSGDYNTAVGSLAGLNANGVSTGNVFIGANAGPSGVGVVSNKLYIANAAGTPLIYGDFTAASVGIGTTFPQNKLDIAGGLAVGSYAGTATAPTNGAIISGNVGIGTSAPTYILDLVGSTDFMRTITINSTPIVFLPNQSGSLFQGSIAFGNGLRNLANVAGNDGQNNTALGISALFSNTRGYENSAVGAASLYSNTTGSNNVAIGDSSLRLNISGGTNTGLGNKTLQENTTGYSNVAVGYNSLSNNTTGNNNIAIGIGAGNFDQSSLANISSTNSIYIGQNTKSGDSGNTNEIVIGDSALGAGSNSIVLGNSSIAKTVLQGNVGIGTTAPSYTLDVSGTLRVTGQAYTNTGNGSFSILSDVRYKDVHGTFDRGLAEILDIDIIKFNYKKDNPLGSDSSHEYVGVSAQNLQQVIPEAVEPRKVGKEEYLTINTSPVLWTLINAVKQFYKQVMERFEGQDRQIASIVESKADKAEIEDLRKDNVTLKQKAAKVDKLEADNAAKAKEIDALKAYLCSKDPAASICK